MPDRVRAAASEHAAHWRALVCATISADPSRIEPPTLIFQKVDDSRERRGGREMAARIPDNQYIGLTGGHFLLRHRDEIRAAIADYGLQETGGRA